MLAFLAFSHIPSHASGFRGFSRFSGFGYLKDTEAIKIMLLTSKQILFILKSSKS
jgi:hypothetical protein